MERDSTILMNDLRQHQPAACQQLLTEYGPAVFRMVQRIVTCREDAEEVYQDVFVKALHGIGGYNPRQASLSTWLNRIAYHEALNFVRGKKPTLLYIEDHVLGVNTLEASDDAPQDEQTIEQLEQATQELKDSMPDESAEDTITDEQAVDQQTQNPFMPRPRNNNRNQQGGNQQRK